MASLKAQIRPVYNRLLRPHLPRKLAVCNGVVARAVRLLDATDVIPDYEDALIDGLRATAGQGDDVVIVGGGYGVSSVVAAECVGENETVSTFEGSAEQVGLVEETLDLNGVTERVDVEHAAVGSDPNLYSDAGGAQAVAPTDLPDCDVLVLDCEGAEEEILRKMSAKPESVVVETHGQYGTPPATVRDTLTDRGYGVTRETEMEPQLGMWVLVAQR